MATKPGAIPVGLSAVHTVLTKKKKKRYSSSGGHRSTPQACNLCKRSWVLCQCWALNIGHKDLWDLKQCHGKLWGVHKEGQMRMSTEGNHCYKDDMVCHVSWRGMKYATAYRGMVWCVVWCHVPCHGGMIQHGIWCAGLLGMAFRDRKITSIKRTWSFISINLLTFTGIKLSGKEEVNHNN